MTSLTKINAKPPTTARQFDLKRFDRLCEDLDRVATLVGNASSKQFNLLYRSDSTDDVLLRKAICEAGTTVRELQSDTTKALIANCRLQLRQVDPPDAYDRDGNISIAVASFAVAQLVGSFPNTNPHDPQTFTAILIGEVAAARPRWPEIETAFRTLRRTKKFMPTISEVLEAIEEAKKAWRNRRRAIEEIDAQTKKLVASFDRARDRLKAAQQQLEDDRQARRTPEIGDRVKHWHLWRELVDYGVGTVTHVVHTCLGSIVTVDFDNSGVAEVSSHALLRLLPGDKGYAR